MLPYVDPAVPVVGICNISETFFEFLNRAPDDATRTSLIKGEQYRGDRAIVWLGDGKLVFTSFAIPHAEHLYRQAGYKNTRYLAPENPTAWLSQDILREQALMNALLEYVGEQRVVQLIPYATTAEFLQLVETLRSEYGLTVLLPETPSPEAIWVRDYIDTKVGFRVMAGRWLPNSDDLLLDGVPCHNADIASQVAYWYIQQGQACVVKADIGENGFGNKVVRPGDYFSAQEILDMILSYPYIGTLWITVEELVTDEKLLSPSLEVYVPPKGHGLPYVTYLSDQVFQQFGDFCGVLVSRELTEKVWYSTLVEAGLCCARHLQAMGYVGHFDMDAVANEERIYPLEINPRRTGGTHVHEFAYHVFGPDYLDRVALLSNDAMHSGDIRTFDELLDVVGDMQYPMHGDRERGVFVTITSALESHEFGCIVVAPTAAEAIQLQQELVQRVQSVELRA